MVKFKVIGHRGARGLAPENTLASFKKALEFGVDQIEFDVRVSEDGVPLIHHDRRIKDASGAQLEIANSSYETLKHHKPDLPTLDESLSFIRGRVSLYIEVKPGVQIQPIVETLAGYKHDYALGSKSQSTLLKLHKALPNVPTIVIEPWSSLRARRRAKQLNTSLLAMNQHFLWFGFIRAMKHAGYQLYAYTINDPKKARRWAKNGLAGVVTDRPDLFSKN